MISVITEADPWCGDTREEVVIHSGMGQGTWKGKASRRIDS